MALEQKGGPVLNFSVQDNNRKKSTFSVPIVATANTAALALGIANTIRDALVNVTDARLIGASVTYNFGEDVAPAAADPGSEVERKLRLVITDGEGGPVRSIVSVPSPDPAIESPNTDTVSVLQPQVQALIAALIGNIVTNRGEALTIVEDAYVSHVNRKRS